jgi:hypothetical protein
MPQWGKNDASSNAVLWAGVQVEAGSGKVARAANNLALYGNTTSGAFVAGQTVGLFGVTDDESQAVVGIKAPGWVLVKTGTGGRAGRVTYETLVAMTSMTGDSDGNTIPNYSIIFIQNPNNTSSNTTANAQAIFSSAAMSAPFGGSITYQWQANTGGGFANVANGAVYSNVATNVLFISNTSGLNGSQYRVSAFLTGAVNVNSGSATLIVTS